MIKGEKIVRINFISILEIRQRFIPIKRTLVRQKGNLKMIRQHCGCSVTLPLVLCHTGDILHRTSSVWDLDHGFRRGESTTCSQRSVLLVCLDLSGGYLKNWLAFVLYKVQLSQGKRKLWLWLKGISQKHSKASEQPQEITIEANKRHVWSLGENLSASPPSSILQALEIHAPLFHQKASMYWNKYCPISLLCNQWNSWSHWQISKPSHRMHLLTWYN